MSEEKETFQPPPLRHVKYLKNMRTSRVMIATPELEKRGDMVPCDNRGQLLKGHVGDVVTDAKKIRESKYIGFMPNGIHSRLFFYTEQLAAKPGAIAVDDPAEWSGDVSGVVAPPAGEDKKLPENPGPALSRDIATQQHNQAVIDSINADNDVDGVPGDETTTDEQESPEQLTADTSTNADPGYAPIPDISGIEDEKEAKDLLKSWALEQFGIQLDGRLGPQKMLSECEAMIMPAQQQAAG